MKAIRTRCDVCGDTVLSPDDVTVWQLNEEYSFTHCGVFHVRRLTRYHELALAIVGCQVINGAEIEEAVRA